jgi:hypothetical protein
MKSSSFSVGISDLIADKKTHDDIIQIITKQKQEVQDIINKVHLGIFENNTASSNMVEFETNVNNILNKATEQSGKIGRKSLSKSNRFLMIVNSGSKGTLINISQMISCLGQTNVDGKRIPYGFENRSLPHFTKYDDSPNARGFIENSYISGLTAPELFFHAMGGRIGLIDTAVKSVTWETPIVILENGRPLYTEIGRWIDRQLDECDHREDIQYFTEKQMELLNTSDIYIPTTDENGNVTWGEVTAITRHDPGKELYEIKTRGGRSVIVTESKSLLIWNEEKRILEERYTPQIRVGNFVPVTGVLCEPPVIIREMDIKGETIKMNYSVGALFGSCETEVPVESFFAPEEFVCGMLSGYFSSKGSTIQDDSIEYTCSSKKTVESLNMLCSRLAIYGDIIINTIEKTYTLKVSNQWGQKFVETVKLFDEEKQRKMNSIQWAADSNTTTNSVFQDIVLDEIVEINIVSVEKYPKVYDLTIPSTLNFGLANGLQVRDTSQTGYIQRRLIKGLEDLKVEYDMTVRNNKGKIVQFAYGDDGFESTRVENQMIQLVNMSIEDIYVHYDMVPLNETEVEMSTIYAKGTYNRFKRQKKETKNRCVKYINIMIDARKQII